MLSVGECASGAKGRRLELSVPDRFEVLGPLGEGAMGVVFEAFDRERNARVALKTLKSLSSRRAGAEALLRFKREFRALQDLHHRNLVSLGELIAEGHQWFFTMELVEGSDFLSYVRPRAPMESGGVFAMDEGDRPSSTADDAPVHFKRVVGRSAGAAVRLDETRLRATLPQLASGLEALHAAGKVHRDIKPSNVRVTPAGRVVLLDFGLIAEVSERSSIDGEIAGTPAYMAPEQATSQSVGPEADWYALGVMLYEALTGLLPFDGTSLEVMMNKQTGTPRPPRALSPGVPADLDDLCMRLLQVEPSARPPGDEILRALSPRGRPSGAPGPGIALTRGAPFVGRARELEQLEQAFLETMESSATVVLVDGESGVGKSCLVRRFTEDVAAAHPTTVVLTGRCYEREQVPYKGFDGAVDALAGHLASLPDEEALELVPDRAGPLVQIFPVLRRSRAFAFAMTEEPGDPRELRRRAFAALRTLVGRLCERHPVVVAIDDLQWADADSLSLLSELLRGPDAPPVLLVGTVRDTPIPEVTMSIGTPRRSPVDFAEQLPCAVRIVHLDRLPEDDAHALATSLLESMAPHRARDAGAIAREAQGHPLFIDELARHAALLADREIVSDDPDDTTVLVRPTFDLDEALLARISRLEKSAREALELVAVAGRPLAQQTVALASGMDMGPFARIVSQLRVAHLVQTSGARASDRIEPYHERVRGAVVACLSASERAACHKRLALALEASRWPDGEALSLHWARAGNQVRAAKYAVAAAHQATEALAFDRAAACWERALDLTADDDPKKRALRARLGEALANAGRGALAAKAYSLAADAAPPGEALDLRRRASEQFLRSGRFDEGIVAVREVLGLLGLGYPRSPVHALVLLVFWRALLALRGMRYRERDASSVSSRELTRVDVCWSVAFALGVSDHIYGSVFQARAMLFALQAGEPTRVSRALAVSGGYLATKGVRSAERVTEHLEKASAIAERTGDPQSIAYAIANSAVSHYLVGDFRRTIVDADRAAALFRDRVPGTSWEQATAHHFALMGLVHVGDLRELQRRQPLYLRDALDRGDAYAAVCMRMGYANFVWLVRGDSPGARREVLEAMEAWSKKGTHLEHFYELVALVNADLYDGRPSEGLRRVNERWRALRRVLLFRIETVRIRCLEMRARCALALAAASERAAEREALIVAAERDARRIAAERAPWALGLAQLSQAAAAALRGDRSRAVGRLREAITSFESAEMAMHATAARHRLARLLGGDEQQALEARTSAWLRDQGVADAEALVSVLAPGFPR
ncbi:MAG: AAA family ATPase [Polyangiaceae bacterium]|jgi:serine/threonine protein kinase/tetratricopeptide (TPR) repeat protein